MSKKIDWENKDEVWQRIGANKSLIEEAPDHIRSDKKLLLKAIDVATKGGRILEHVDEALRADKNFMLAALKAGSDVLKWADESLKADKEFLIAAAKTKRKSNNVKGIMQDDTDDIVTEVLENTDNSVRADKDFWVAILKHGVKGSRYGGNIDFLFYAPENIIADREVVMAAVKRDESALNYASDKLKADKEIVMASVKHAGVSLSYADDSLQADREVVMTAVKNDEGGQTLKFASAELQSDKKVLMAALKSSFRSFYSIDAGQVTISESLKADKDVAKALEIAEWKVKVSEDPWRYEEKAPDHIKANEEVAIETVRERGDMLEHMDDAFKANKKVVMVAVNQSGHALEYADDALKSDKSIVTKALNENFGALQYADDSLKSDKKFILGFAEIDLYFVSDALKADKEVVMASARYGGNLKYASKALKADKEVVMANPDSLEYASKSLKADKEVVWAALKESPGNLEYASKALKADKELVMANPFSLYYAADSLKADKEVVMAAVKEYAGNLQYASKALKADKEVVMAAVQGDGSSLKYADDLLKADKDIVLMALHTQYKSYGDTENVFKFVDKSLRRDADVKKARAGGEVTRNKEMVFKGEGGEYQLNIHTSTEAKEYMKDIESSNPLDYFDGGQGGNVSAFYGIELGELKTQFPKADVELIADNKNFASPIPPSKGKHIEELYVTKGEVYSEGFVVQIDAEEEFEEEKLTFQYSIACFAIAHHVNEIEIVHNVLYDGKEIDDFYFTDGGSEVTVSLVGYDKEDNQVVFYDSRYMDKVDWEKMSDLLDY